MSIQTVGDANRQISRQARFPYWSLLALTLMQVTLAAAVRGPFTNR